MAHDKPDPLKKLLISPVDGSSRSIKAEQLLNMQFAMLFRDEAGRNVLNYLRSITLNRIGTPDMPNRQLRYLEGMRGLFGMIQKRVELGQKGTPNVRVQKP